MKLDNFHKDDSVLLVGEGNFSFAASLARKKLEINITATCYESEMIHETGRKNIEYLVNNGLYFYKIFLNYKIESNTYFSNKKAQNEKVSMIFVSGVEVLLGVDATKLSNTKSLKNEFFDKIIFNFPHSGGKMRIEKNRDLLKRFFISAKDALKLNGVVIISLCNGQSGTNFDSPMRRWDDSWKLIEMAAYGDFKLSHAEPFDFSIYEEYSVTGYRSLEKGFNTDKCISFHFELSPFEIEHLRTFENLELSSYKANQACYAELVGNSSTTKELLPCLVRYKFDVTFSIDSSFSEQEFYILVNKYVGNIVEDVQFLSSYESKDDDVIKKKTRTYRITYNNRNIPLYKERALHVHTKILADLLEQNLNVKVDR